MTSLHALTLAAYKTPPQRSDVAPYVSAGRLTVDANTIIRSFFRARRSPVCVPRTDSAHATHLYANNTLNPG
jgi:hypothetical protein